MNVAWEVAVLFLCVSQGFFWSNLWPRRAKCSPKTCETDVDEQVSTTSRDEENADGGN